MTALTIPTPDIALLSLTVAVGAVSVVLTGVIRSYAIRHRILDAPNQRSSHTAPTPRGGGAAIVIATVFGFAGGSAVGLVDGRIALAVSLGTLALAVVGWFDDRRSLDARWRMGIHIGVAIWTLVMLGPLPAIRLGDTVVHLGIVGWLAGILGIVWSINLFNFMDGIDGLAGSQALLIFGAGAVLLFMHGDTSLATTSMIVAAASSGFLVWNWPPAKIFLGDVGSGAVGYLVAALAIASENRGSVPLLVFAILGSVFVFDATVTLIRRVARGHSPAEAHRDHAYQRLARAWGSHRPVTVRAAAVTLFFAALGTAGTVRSVLLLPALLLTFMVSGALFIAAERRAPMGS